MEYRKLGKTELMVSPICMGTVNFIIQVAEPEASRIIKRALEMGVNFFDTASVYAGGQAEETLGRALQGARNSVILSTKIGQFIRDDGVLDADLSQERVTREVENSLRRLGTDYIDLCYVHQPDYNTPIEETLRALDALVKQGKVRYIACSNFRAFQLALSLGTSALLKVARFNCVQTPYNLIGREIEYELLPLCESQEIGVTAYSPLAGGLLTGRYEQKKRPEQGRFAVKRLGAVYHERYWRDEYFRAVSRLKTIAGEHGVSLARFSIAWILHKRGITSAVIGVSSAEQLAENLGSAQIKLTAEELKACDEVWQEIWPDRFLYGR